MRTHLRKVGRLRVCPLSPGREAPTLGTCRTWDRPCCLWHQAPLNRTTRLQESWTTTWPNGSEKPAPHQQSKRCKHMPVRQSNRRWLLPGLHTQLHQASGTEGHRTAAAALRPLAATNWQQERSPMRRPWRKRHKNGTRRLDRGRGVARKAARAARPGNIGTSLQRTAGDASPTPLPAPADRVGVWPRPAPQQ